MKNLMLTLAASLWMSTFFGVPGTGEPKTLKVDATKSVIYWTGKKITGEHQGTLMLKSGNVEIGDDGLPTAATLQIDMSSIAVTDIEDKDTNAKLVGHLHSPDFFSTEQFPKGSFEASSFEPIAGAADREANYTVKGTLTLKGVSNEISFPAFIAVKNSKLVANGKLTFDRTKFNIKYGSGSFFDDLGDKAIYDDIEMNFVLAANI